MVKITIITPCYNGEQHLIPYINGLLSQTFSNVEYIFVDDGSTDKTEEIINSYKEQFETKGWTFTYIKQQARGGQAKAINQGLKVFTGDYLCCIDSDDIIMPTYLEDMSNVMETHKECGIAFPWVDVIEEKTNKHIKYFKRDIPEGYFDPLFDDFINENWCENYICYPTFMLRSSSFLAIYPDRHIYEGFGGQNAQLILPILYNYKCGYVKKIIFKYLVRKGSDSHITNIENNIRKTYNWEDTWCNVIKTIPNMPDYEKAYYFNLVKNKYDAHRLRLKLKLQKRSEMQKKRKKSILEYIFSITNEYTNNYKRKVITIFGIKFKIKVKKLKK